LRRAGRGSTLRGMSKIQNQARLADKIRPLFAEFSAGDIIGVLLEQDRIAELLISALYVLTERERKKVGSRLLEGTDHGQARSRLNELERANNDLVDIGIILGPDKCWDASIDK